MGMRGLNKLIYNYLSPTKITFNKFTESQKIMKKRNRSHADIFQNLKNILNQFDY